MKLYESVAGLPGQLSAPCRTKPQVESYSACTPSVARNNAGTVFPHASSATRVPSMALPGYAHHENVCSSQFGLRVGESHSRGAADSRLATHPPARGELQTGHNLLRREREGGLYETCASISSHRVGVAYPRNPGITA